MALWQVTPDAADSRAGRLTGPLIDAACALGRGGVIDAARKREGDGATPAGTYPVRRVFYRPDRQPPPVTALPVAPLDPGMGWCDAPDDPRYNRLVRLPFGPSHETLWRDDGLYDLILVIGHNDAPVVPGAGSAIFVHVAGQPVAGVPVTDGPVTDGPPLPPTEGCVALAAVDLRAVLRAMTPACRLTVASPL